MRREWWTSRARVPDEELRSIIARQYMKVLRQRNKVTFANAYRPSIFRRQAESTVILPLLSSL